MVRTLVQFAVVTLLGGSYLLAQETAAALDDSKAPEAAGEAQPELGAIETEEGEDPTERTTLNLLGEVDSESGEGRRNENVRLTLIDNNVLKELNTRMGTTATVTQEFRIDQNYFGKQYGGRPTPAIHLPSSNSTGFHGNIFWSHNNSVFSARSFFQVGKVQPAHTNDYGFIVDFAPWKGARLTVNGSRRRLRGQVNGNVLVPAPDERIPTTTDPEDRAIVERILAAYPAELPNRTDINKRALNTNAPQNIDNDRIGGTLDQRIRENDRLILKYHFTIQKVEAFQLVGGQNPDTTTRNHVARMTWTRVWSPTTTSDFTIGFDRIGSLLVPEETSIGAFYLFARELNSIGPGGNIPIDRSQNMYRGGGRVQQIHGHHTLTYGFELLRRQINGWESNEHRGVFSFRRDFGRSTIANLLEGTPSVYLLATGNAHRGFRNWEAQFYAGDVWKATTNLSLTFGLRYQPVTSPTEVNGLSYIPYDSDWNNLGPRFALAYRLPGSWGTLRASYGIHFGEIFPATFMQSRFNPPGTRIVSARAPKLSDPLREIVEDDRSELYQIASELSTPYVHLYNFQWELRFGSDWALDLGYVGSRSHKLLTMWYLNRAEPVEGIPQISRTVNERRPDQRYYDVKHILNGSRGYFDAAKVTLRIPRAAGFNADISYWFSKAIDLGASYTNTAAGRDGRASRGPSMYEFQAEMRGLSRFDQPHALLTRVNYETPSLTGRQRAVRAFFGSWQISSVVLVKSGTPFSVSAGSDAPGWGNVDGASGDNPILLDPSILYRSIDHPDTSAARLPREAFTTIRPTDPRGNLGRNTFRKDGVANVNLALSRRWFISGDQALLFRLEGLNVLNHPQFEEPGRSLTSDNFAQITNTLNDGRAFHFTLQFDW